MRIIPMWYTSYSSQVWHFTFIPQKYISVPWSPVEYTSLLHPYVLLMMQYPCNKKRIHKSYLLSHEDNQSKSSQVNCPCMCVYVLVRVPCAYYILYNSVSETIRFGMWSVIFRRSYLTSDRLNNACMHPTWWLSMKPIIAELVNKWYHFLWSNSVVYAQHSRLTS